MHLFFSKKSSAPEAASQDDETGPFRWKRPPFLPSTCLFAENLKPEIRPKISAFDLDGTVVQFSPFNSNEEEYVLWHDDIPRFLKEAYDEGFVVIFLSFKHRNT